MGLFSKDKARVNLMMLGEPYYGDEPSWLIETKQKEEWLGKLREGYTKGLEYSSRRLSQKIMDDISGKIIMIEKASRTRPEKNPSEYALGLGLIIGLLRDEKNVKHILLGLRQETFSMLINALEGNYSKAKYFIKAAIEKSRSVPEIDRHLLHLTLKRKKNLKDVLGIEF